MPNLLLNHSFMPSLPALEWNRGHCARAARGRGTHRGDDDFPSSSAPTTYHRFTRFSPLPVKIARSLPTTALKSTPHSSLAHPSSRAQPIFRVYPRFDSFTAQSPPLSVLHPWSFERKYCLRLINNKPNFVHRYLSSRTFWNFTTN